MSARVRVYLAGGLRSGWQDAVLDRDAVIDWVDPRALQGVTDLPLLARIERQLIRECDFVLVFYEADNPSGVGLAAEMGYAAGLGRGSAPRVLYVDARVDRGSTWLAGFADAEFATLEEAVDFVEAWALDRLPDGEEVVNDE